MPASANSAGLYQNGVLVGALVPDAVELAVTVSRACSKPARGSWTQTPRIGVSGWIACCLRERVEGAGVGDEGDVGRYAALDRGLERGVHRAAALARRS